MGKGEGLFDFDGLPKRLLAGECDFAEAAAALGARFQDLRAVYLSRWVTPSRFSRRYDTRFFLTVLPSSQAKNPRHENTLVVDYRLWDEYFFSSIVSALR